MTITSIFVVIVPPQLKYLPKDIETFERIDIKIPCEVTGNPRPKITWHKNGDVIDEIKFEHIKVGDDGITIMEALESDEGIYQCFAKNDGGEVKASAQLTIKRKSMCRNIIFFFDLHCSTADDSPIPDIFTSIICLKQCKFSSKCFMNVV